MHICLEAFPLLNVFFMVSQIVFCSNLFVLQPFKGLAFTVVYSKQYLILDQQETEIMNKTNSCYTIAPENFQLHQHDLWISGKE